MFDAAATLEALYAADPKDATKYFPDEPGVAYFDSPICAVADAADPWFDRFKEVLGEFHWTPAEAFALAFPGREPRTIISWALPICQQARRDNGREKNFPAKRWAQVRALGEAFNSSIRAGMVEAINAAGAHAVAPLLMPQCATAMREKVGLACTWSERHVAFVAGLGTFGISGNLITMRGAAHRLGSVITDLDLPVTPRPYGDEPFGWCLREACDPAEAACGACIARCPAGAIGFDHTARDKPACRSYVLDNIMPRARELYDLEANTGCGLCQTAVPCEFRNPMA